MLTMNLIEIAQILTGTATLIVAIVLLFQIRIQQRSLNLSHRDADRELTYRSLEMLVERHRILIENPNFRDIYIKRHQGLENLSESEKTALFSYFFMFFGQINTDYRLGRLSNEKYYYRMVCEIVMDSISGLEWYRDKGRSIFEYTPKKGRKKHIEFLQGIGDEVYEEKTGNNLNIE